MLKLNWDDVIAKRAAKLSLWQGQNLSEMGSSTVVKAQIAPIVLYTGTVLPLPNDVDTSLSRITYKFIGKGSEKKARALLCKRKDRGGRRCLQLDPNTELKDSWVSALQSRIGRLYACQTHNLALHKVSPNRINDT